MKLLDEIEADVPKGNSTQSMAAWLRMNRVRALTTDLLAWFCFIVESLKAL
jgi:hypothetical protein